MSALSPIPSLSKSAYSVASSGNASISSVNPSPSSSLSVKSPIPSPSVSRDSVESNGKASSISYTPSLSSSMSSSKVVVQLDNNVSGYPSWSVSVSAQLSLGKSSNMS